MGVPATTGGAGQTVWGFADDTAYHRVGSGGRYAYAGWSAPAHARHRV